MWIQLVDYLTAASLRTISTLPCNLDGRESLVVPAASLLFDHVFIWAGTDRHY